MCHNCPVNGVRLLVVAVSLTLQAGCTSALSTAYLRDALWDVAEHAAESAAEVPAGDGEAAPDAADRVAGDVAEDRADADRRQAAIEEAVERLSRIGTLDAAAQTTLVETLQATQQEDWPVVIEAFSATLAESQPAKAEPDSEPPPEPHVVAKAPADAAPAEPAAAPDAASATVVAPEPPVASVPPSPAASEPPPEPAAAAIGPQFAIRNACFASRVRAWGDVERFPDERFRPGQEVIVYFELDGLSAAESAAGFRTSIDTALRLVDAEGGERHAWNFEPITETCPARRHDYFARYVVRLPESAAGSCRVEVTVSDTLAGATATATLPCAVE